MHIFRVFSEVVFPFIRKCLRHHMFDRQTFAGRRFVRLVGFHHRAQDCKRRSSCTTTVGLSRPNTLADIIVPRNSNTLVSELSNPLQPVLRIIFVSTWFGRIGKFRHGLVGTRRRTISQPQAREPSRYVCKSFREVIVRRVCLVDSGSFIEQPQRQRAVDIHSQIPQVPQFFFHFSVGMLTRRAGQDSIKSREPRQVPAKFRALLRRGFSCLSAQRLSCS